MNIDELADEEGTVPLLVWATTGLLEGCMPMTQLPPSHSITTTTLIDCFVLRHTYNLAAILISQNTRRAQDGVTKRAQELIFLIFTRSKACVHKLISF